jgi:pimeloyl-ACP methyl ester carboxylesterase
VDRFVIAGHSFGATISLFIAAQNPQRVEGVILFDGGALPSEEAIQFFEGYYDTLQYRFSSAEDYVGRYRNGPLYQPWTDAMEQMVRSNLYQQPDGTFIRRVPRYVLDADRRSEQLDTWKNLPELYPQVRCPVLILRAEMGIMGVEDRLLSDPVIAQMQAGMPNSNAVTVIGAGHTSLLTIPSPERDEAILNFLGISS